MNADPQAHRQELLGVFKITAADIEANRQGQLGPGQKRRLRQRAANAVLIMLGMIAVFVAIIVAVAAKPLRPVQWVLIVAVIAAGLAAAFYQGRRLREALRAGTVERYAGPVRTSMRGRTGWWLTVSDESFHLPVRFWHVGTSLRYRVYVAPAAQLIVAMEPEPGPRLSLSALLATPITFTHTGDELRPFRAQVDGVTLDVQVNDFPAHPPYSVLADGSRMDDLDDWPPAWTRP
ncbi:MAG TPA: hypothetical protein VGF32_15600 [Streptosporangiaceae bacterium]|jgi:hypothetical protein